jgi:hypothetical protein
VASAAARWPRTVQAAAGLCHGALDRIEAQGLGPHGREAFEEALVHRLVDAEGEDAHVLDPLAQAAQDLVLVPHLAVGEEEGTLPALATFGAQGHQLIPVSGWQDLRAPE